MCAKTPGLVDLFVSVMRRMYHCHLNGRLRQWGAGGRRMRRGAEMGIKVTLCGKMMEEVAARMAHRGKSLGRVMCKHDNMNGSLKEEVATFSHSVCRIFQQKSLLFFFRFTRSAGTDFIPMVPRRVFLF